MSDSFLKFYDFDGRNAAWLRQEVLDAACKAAMDPRIVTEPDEIMAETNADLQRLGIDPAEWQGIVQQSLRAAGQV